MNISTTSLTTERRWRSATGYDENRFRRLLLIFEDSYYEKFGKTLLERKADSPKESAIKSAEDLLLFTLFSLKSAGRPAPTDIRPARLCDGNGCFQRET